MLILRIRQAEVALADNRLDEAYHLILQHGLASHRRGQRLITRLATALVKRGNEHLKCERLTEALADGEKAAKIAGSLADIVALRAAAADAHMQRQRQQNQQQRLVNNARQQVEQGHLNTGANLLDDAPLDITRVQLLRHDIENRRAAAASAIRHAKSAQDRGHLHVAADEILSAQAAHPRDSEISNLKSEIIARITKQIRSCFSEGHLHRADDLLSRLLLLDDQNPEAKELATVAQHLSQAWRHVSNHNLTDARVTLARVATLIASPSWLKGVIQQLEQAEEALTQLQTGPLAWLNAPAAAPAMPELQADYKPQPIPARMPPVTPLPMELVLHADGVGSFVILRRPVVTLGPISSSTACEIALIAEANLPPVKIERVEEDYFLSTKAALKPALLASGQKIELSPRCRLSFSIPNPASTSAVLDLPGAKLPRSDIRRIILMDHDLIIGPGSAAHVSAPQVAENIVLHVRNNQLFCQTRQPMLVNNQPADIRQPLPLGTQIKIGDLAFVLTPRSQDTR